MVRVTKIHQVGIVGITRLICIIIATLFAIFIMNSRQKPSTISVEEAKSYAARITGHAVSGVPVIIFASESCPGSNELEQEMKDQHINYIRADVVHDPTAKSLALTPQIGTVTPTIVIGTKVLRGATAKIILGELAEQRLNKEFR